MSFPLEVSSSRPPFWLDAPREEPTWPAGRLDVRFDSEDALHRAVALLDGQTWVEDCRIDLGERTLHLRLATDTAPGFSLAIPGATDLH